MLDSRLLKTDPEGVARNLARRGFALDVARLRALEERRKSLQVAVDEVRAARNVHAKTVGQARAQGQDIAPLLGAGRGAGDEARRNRCRARPRTGGIRGLRIDAAESAA
jgi:seryl-tRNA synthetase